MTPFWRFGRIGRVAVMDGSTVARTLASEVTRAGACERGEWETA